MNSIEEKDDFQKIEDKINEIIEIVNYLNKRQNILIECLNTLENIFKTINADISNLTSRTRDT